MNLKTLAIVLSFWLMTDASYAELLVIGSQAGESISFTFVDELKNNKNIEKVGEGNFVNLRYLFPYAGDSLNQWTPDGIVLKKETDVSSSDEQRMSAIKEAMGAHPSIGEEGVRLLLEEELVNFSLVNVRDFRYQNRRKEGNRVMATVCVNVQWANEKYSRHVLTTNLCGTAFSEDGSASISFSEWRANDFLDEVLGTTKPEVVQSLAEVADKVLITVYTQPENFQDLLSHLMYGKSTFDE